MAGPGSAPVTVLHDPANESERRRRVRRSAILFAVIAATFYFGFIAMMLLRGAK